MPSCIKLNELFSILKRKFNNSLTFYKTGHKQYEKKTIYCCFEVLSNKTYFNCCTLFSKKIIEAI